MIVRFTVFLLGDINMSDTVFYGCICVVVMMILDYITGVIKAIMQKNLNSQKMREGLGHKFVYIIIVFLSWFIEFESGHIDLGFNLPLFVPVVVGITLIEITSILENCVDINPELSNSKIFDIFKNDNEVK